MNSKKIISMVFGVAFMFGMVGVANAQETSTEPPDQRFLQEVMGILFEVTGLEREQIIEEIRAGKTVAELIEASGGNVEAVIDEVVALATQRINARVTNGQLSQNRADKLLENLEVIVTKAINGELRLGDRRPGNDRPPRQPARMLVNAVADATGLDQQAIVEELRAGSTLANILTANDIDVDGFIDDQIAIAMVRLDEAVADGKMTREQANERLNRLEERLIEALNRQISQPEGTETPNGA